MGRSYHDQRDTGCGSFNKKTRSASSLVYSWLSERISNNNLWAYDRWACTTHHRKVPCSVHFTDEIAIPTGADFRLGVPEEDWPRTADTVTFPAEAAAAVQIDTASLLDRALQGSACLPYLPNDPNFRKSENGSFGGFSNARALARTGSLVSLNGTVDGK